MKFKRENTKPIEAPSEKQISSSLAHLKGSKRSFATLSTSDESHIQMAGGGFSCILEISIAGKTQRASQEKAIVPWNEDTSLHTTCGDFVVRPKEYLSIAQVTEAFVQFLNGERRFDQYKWEEQKLKT